MTIPINDRKLTLLTNLTVLKDENDVFMGMVVVLDDLTTDQGPAHGRLARGSAQDRTRDQEPAHARSSSRPSA